MDEQEETANVLRDLSAMANLDSHFTGFALEAYRLQKHMSRAELATWLGVELAGLDRLAVCRRESTLNTDYTQRVQWLVVDFGLDPARLDAVYRTVIEFPAPTESDAIQMLQAIKACAAVGAVEDGNAPAVVAADALRQLQKVTIAGYLDNTRVLTLAGVSVAQVHDIRTQLESIQAKSDAK